jgi:hypothetical protein
MDFPASKSIHPAPYKKTGTLVIFMDFRAISSGRGGEGGESEGENKRGGGGRVGSRRGLVNSLCISGSGML